MFSSVHSDIESPKSASIYTSPVCIETATRTESVDERALKDAKHSSVESDRSEVSFFPLFGGMLL